MTAHLIVFFGSLFAMLAIRLPVFLAMILATLVYALTFQEMSPVVIVQTLNRGLENPLLSAIPLFFLTGTVMNAGGMTQRLVELASNVLAGFRGGLAHVNIGASMLFGGLTGSALADVSAIGSMMIPAMKKEGYSPAYAAAVTAASAPISLLIPPSIPMVLFGLFNDAPIDALFIAGIVPGLLMGAYLLVVSALIARRRGYPRGNWAGWRALWQALRGCLMALLLPVFVITALVTGLGTITEIGALAVTYAVLVSTLVYRDVTITQLWETIVSTAEESVKILSIIAVAAAPLWISANLGVDQAIAAYFKAAAWNRLELLGAVALLLVLIGTVVGPGFQLILVVPMLTPVLVEAGIELTQIGMVCVLAAAIGLITPPIGILIFLTASQARASVVSVVRELLPFLGALLLLLVALVCFPGLSEAPEWLLH